MPPPPPPKRIKRPAKVLDEDDYTEALSQIIARDYFPGLLESTTQQEYLLALESNNPAWIAEAGNKLREVMTPGPHTRSRQARAARNSRFNTPLPGGMTPRNRATPGATPRGFTGEETPASSVAETEDNLSSNKKEIDTSSLSLSAFQSKYTSEDNESFNALLDKQNTKRREKHAYMWVPDQRIPSARQIAYRDREAKMLKQMADDDANGRALVPITVEAGGAATRPARPDAWKIKRPDNAFMFSASSVDEDGVETVMETRERTSRAGPKAVVHANTRLPPPPLKDEAAIPPSPSLSAVRDAIAGRPRLSASEIDASGGGDETPRVNGYAFVDEDEPENVPTEEETTTEPSYRDLLAGQFGDATPNPFKIGEVRRREDLHHRMVERDAKKKRAKQVEKEGEGRQAVPRFPSSPMVNGTTLHGSVKGQAASGSSGALTPAAKRLLDRVGRTPVGGRLTGGGEEAGRTALRNMWTPTTTPRRRAVEVERSAK
jgi:protein DGCR14